MKIKALAFHLVGRRFKKNISDEQFRMNTCTYTLPQIVSQWIFHALPKSENRAAKRPMYITWCLELIVWFRILMSRVVTSCTCYIWPWSSPRRCYMIGIKMRQISYRWVCMALSPPIISASYLIIRPSSCRNSVPRNLIALVIMSWTEKSYMYVLGCCRYDMTWTCEPWPGDGPCFFFFSFGFCHTRYRSWSLCLK